MKTQLLNQNKQTRMVHSTNQSTIDAPQITIERVTNSNIHVAKSLHEEIFPVTYPDSFYDELLFDRNKMGFLIKSDVHIGTISVVYFPDHVYIMTFGLLNQYRRRKIGGFCLKMFESFVLSNGVSKIFLHVQVVNKVACLFYKKCGYKKIQKDDFYYESLDNKKAYLFYKCIKCKEVDAQL